MTNPAVPFNSMRRVCLRAPNWIGDVVMATPTFRAVREHFPDARVTVVMRRRVAPVLQGAPWFDETVVYDPAARGRVRGFFESVKAIRAGDHELGILLPHSFSSALMMRMARVPRRVGYRRDGRAWLLSDAVERPREAGRFKPSYMVDYYLALCGHLGIRGQNRATELPFSRADAERADALMRSVAVRPDSGLVLLHPGAGYGPAKRWPATYFARLAEMLQEEFDAQVAIIAGPDERRTVDKIVMSAAVNVADLSSCGVDLHLLKCVVARSRLLVTTDSGPRHYGVALGIPTVCVMGPNHPDYSTSDRPHDHVVRLDVDCGPCQRKTCPRDHRCMTDITPEMLLEASRRALLDAETTRE